MLTAGVCLLVAMICSALLCLRVAVRAGRDGASMFGERTEADLAQLFVFISARHLLQLTLVLVFVVTAGGAMSRLPWLCVLVSAVVAAFLPRVTVRMLRTRRCRKIAAQIPDALSLWAGLLRAGQGLMQALTQVAARQSEPLGDELRLVLSQQRLGMGMDEAFAAFRDRTGLADLRMLATLLRTNRELGGNLAESLQRLAELLRSRLAMEARIQSLTAQGRLQGLVVGLLPVVLLLVLYAMEPHAMRALHTTWQGWAALGVVAVLETLGFMLIRRIVRIDV